MAEEFLVNENADYFELRPPTIPRFYADADGNYLGSFDGLDEEIPADMANGIEVPVPPQDGLQLWDGDKWLPAAPTPDMLIEEVNRASLSASITISATVAGSIILAPPTRT